MFSLKEKKKNRLICGFSHFVFVSHKTIIPLEPTELVTLNGCILVSITVSLLATSQTAHAILFNKKRNGPGTEGLEYVEQEV